MVDFWSSRSYNSFNEMRNEDEKMMNGVELLNNVQVGDQVAVMKIHNGFAHSISTETIAKVGVRQVEFVSGEKYSKITGQQLKSKVCNYPSDRLGVYTLEFRDELVAATNKRRELKRVWRDLEVAAGKKNLADAQYFVKKLEDLVDIQHC
jgi:hypothetical protein